MRLSISSLGIAALALLALTMPQPSYAAGSTTIRKEAGGFSFVVTATPKLRSASHRVTVTLDIASHPNVPDPTFGDRVPLRKGSLIAKLTPASGGKATFYGLHPLSGAGVYGFHFTPATKGLYSLRFSERQVELPELEFQIGVDVDTPDQGQNQPGKALGLRGLRDSGGRRSSNRGGGLRGPITPMSGGPNAKRAMQTMAEPAALLNEAFAKRRPLRSELEPALAILVEQAATLVGTVPSGYHSASKEYDQLAADLQTGFKAVQAKVGAGKTAAAAKQMNTLRNDVCARCHVKFWWAITPDLSAWPKISASDWKR